MPKKETKLVNFFNPKTIAIIGASDNTGKVGGILFKKALQTGLKIIPVNPNHEIIDKLKCYKNILDYPGKIDLAIIAVPSLFVLGALNECGRKNIKNVIIISAGFSEIGNHKGEEELLGIAKKYGIRILGPNCFGITCPEKEIDLTFSASGANKGNIAFISQSGALWSFISDYFDKDIGFSGFVSLGNMSDLGFSDFIEYFSKDKKTKSIILYMEKIKDGKRFIKVCKNCKKPLYVVKAGESEKGSQAAFSHTASLASNYNVYRGAFKQAGITLCCSLIEAFEKASGVKLISEKGSAGIKIGKKVFIITNAGGAGALMSDYLSKKGFSVVDKPLDILGTASGSDYFNNLEKFKDKDFYDALLVILTPQSMSEMKKTAQVIVNFKEQTGKKIIALFLGKKSMQESNNIFQEGRVDYFNTLEEAIDCLEF